MLTQNRSLTQLSALGLPSGQSSTNLGPKPSSMDSSLLLVASPLKEHKEAGPSQFVRSKPMVCAQTLNHLRMKEFFRTKDLERYESMKHNLDTSVAAIMQKKRTVDPNQYLGPDLVARQRDNIKARIIYKKKARKVPRDHPES